MYRMALYIGNIFFGIGVAYDAGLFSGTRIYDIIHMSFGSTRNFLNVGLLYMCIGHYFAGHQLQGVFGKRNIWFVLLILVLAYRLVAKDVVTLYAYQFPASVFLFLFGLNWNPQISDSKSLILRKWSTIIYLTHFPFILAFDYYLRRGTLIDYPCTLLFCACFYFMLNAFLPTQYLKNLYG